VRKRLKTLKEFLSEKRSAPSIPADPPNVLIMKRKAIRNFPNGQRVALYYVDKINKYVTVPYEAMHWSSSVPDEFKNITLG
jgi:hypothetical protein